MECEYFENKDHNKLKDGSEMYVKWIKKLALILINFNSKTFFKAKYKLLSLEVKRRSDSSKRHEQFLLFFYLKIIDFIAVNKLLLAPNFTIFTELGLIVNQLT